MSEYKTLEEIYKEVGSFPFTVEIKGSNNNPIISRDDDFNYSLRVFDGSGEMTAENFAYWLKGFFEIIEAGDNEGKAKPIDSLTKPQVLMIKQHLNYVFAATYEPVEDV